jgi:hypothetical protein
MKNLRSILVILSIAVFLSGIFFFFKDNILFMSLIISGGMTLKYLIKNRWLKGFVAVIGSFFLLWYIWKINH